VNFKLYALAGGLILAIVLAGTAAFYRAKSRTLEREKAELEGHLSSAYRRISYLDRQLEAEREAVTERASRLNESAAAHEELKRELETCDLDSQWSVPGALYDRLCGNSPAPAP
jgi:predicted  nucleic acid-binding Zn-ribbon protein